MSDLSNTDDVFDLLTKTIGRLVKDATGRKVVLDDDELIPKLEDEFVLVSQTAADQLDWADNEWQDELGNSAITHNYQATYTLTAFKGDAFRSLTKVLQALSLPRFYDNYFPSPCQFAYSSSSTISRLRVPINMQKYENRATVILTFNVKLAAVDSSKFEELQEINLEMKCSFFDPTSLD